MPEKERKKEKKKKRGYYSGIDLEATAPEIDHIALNVITQVLYLWMDDRRM